MKALLDQLHQAKMDMTDVCFKESDIPLTTLQFCPPYDTLLLRVRVGAWKKISRKSLYVYTKNKLIAGPNTLVKDYIILYTSREPIAFLIVATKKWVLFTHCYFPGYLTLPTGMCIILAIDKTEIWYWELVQSH